MVKRMPGLDLLRALLILEGVFYHSSIVMSPIDWYYNSPKHASYSISMFFQVFHFFRMESFFFLAGFFASLVIQRKGVSHYLHDRKKRLLLPFAILIFLVAIPQGYIASLINNDSGFRLNIAHLWFLQILIMLILLHVAFLKINSSVKFKILIPVIVFSIFAWAPTDYISNFLPDYNFIFYSASKLIQFTPFYILGCYAFFNREDILGFVSKRKFVLFIISLMLSSILLYTVSLNWSGEWATYSKLYVYPFKLVIQPLIMFFNAMAITLLLFYFFIKIDKVNNFINLIVASSLVIYILHHPVVIVSSYFIDKTQLVMSDFSYFSLISFLSFAIPLFTYLLFKGNYFFKISFGMNK